MASSTLRPQLPSQPTRAAQAPVPPLLLPTAIDCPCILGYNLNVQKDLLSSGSMRSSLVDQHSAEHDTERYEALGQLDPNPCSGEYTGGYQHVESPAAISVG